MTGIQALALALLPKQDTPAWDHHVRRSATFLRENTPQDMRRRLDEARSALREADARGAFA